MSNLRRLNKKSILMAVRLCIVCVCNVKLNDNLIFVTYQQGSEKGQTKKAYIGPNKIVKFDEEVQFRTKFYSNKKEKWEKKKLKISLKTDKGSNLKTMSMTKRKKEKTRTISSLTNTHFQRNKKKTIGRIILELSELVGCKGPIFSLISFNLHHQNKRMLGSKKLRKSVISDSFLEAMNFEGKEPAILLCIDVADPSKVVITPLFQQKEIKNKIIEYQDKIEKRSTPTTLQQNEKSEYVPYSDYTDYTDYTDFTANSEIDSEYENDNILNNINLKVKKNSFNPKQPKSNRKKTQPNQKIQIKIEKNNMKKKKRKRKYSISHKFKKLTLNKKKMNKNNEEEDLTTSFEILTSISQMTFKKCAPRKAPTILPQNEIFNDPNKKSKESIDEGDDENENKINNKNNDEEEDENGDRGIKLEEETETEKTIKNAQIQEENEEIIKTKEKQKQKQKQKQKEKEKEKEKEEENEIKIEMEKEKKKQEQITKKLIEGLEKKIDKIEVLKKSVIKSKEKKIEEKILDKNVINNLEKISNLKKNILHFKMKNKMELIKKKKILKKQLKMIKKKKRNLLFQESDFEMEKERVNNKKTNYGNLLNNHEYKQRRLRELKIKRNNIIKRNYIKDKLDNFQDKVEGKKKEITKKQTRKKDLEKELLINKIEIEDNHKEKESIEKERGELNNYLESSPQNKKQILLKIKHLKSNIQSFNALKKKLKLKKITNLEQLNKNEKMKKCFITEKKTITVFLRSVLEEKVHSLQRSLEQKSLINESKVELDNVFAKMQLFKKEIATELQEIRSKKQIIQELGNVIKNLNQQKNEELNKIIKVHEKEMSLIENKYFEKMQLQKENILNAKNVIQKIHEKKLLLEINQENDNENKKKLIQLISNKNEIEKNNLKKKIDELKLKFDELNNFKLIKNQNKKQYQGIENLNFLIMLKTINNYNLQLVLYREKKIKLKKKIKYIKNNNYFNNTKNKKFKRFLKNKFKKKNKNSLNLNNNNNKYKFNNYGDDDDDDGDFDDVNNTLTNGHPLKIIIPKEIKENRLIKNKIIFTKTNLLRKIYLKNDNLNIIEQERQTIKKLFIELLRLNHELKIHEIIEKEKWLLERLFYFSKGIKNQKLPVPACLILKFLIHSNSFEKGYGQILDAFINSLQLLIKIEQNNRKNLFWLLFNILFIIRLLIDLIQRFPKQFSVNLLKKNLTKIILFKKTKRKKIKDHLNNNNNNKFDTFNGNSDKIIHKDGIKEDTDEHKNQLKDNHEQNDQEILKISKNKEYDDDDDGDDDEEEGGGVVNKNYLKDEKKNEIDDDDDDDNEEEGGSGDGDGYKNDINLNDNNDDDDDYNNDPFCNNNSSILSLRRKLTKLLRESYLMILSTIYDYLKPRLIRIFLRNKSNYQSKFIKELDYNVKIIIDILNEILQFINSNSCLNNLSVIILNQVLYFINSTIIHELLHKKKFCTIEHSAQIKEHLLKIEKWLDENNLSDSKIHLNPLKNLVDLILMNKAIVKDYLNDFNLYKTVFNSLNFYQIYHVLGNFTPDDLDPIPLTKKNLNKFYQHALKNNLINKLDNKLEPETNSRFEVEIDLLKIDCSHWEHVQMPIQIKEEMDQSFFSVFQEN
ncbi:enolase-phosphatase e1 [Anaeramoeba flamelloides]|uniref:Enolase-phosphatase e1 n=1 Tax=Anaeramoeba flamelloides TaxID=1746091 RepID=A0AAV7YJZ1_9EUKA|nr:enolase-phosphatase e1 [Anaeramoeba flamelloides]